MEIRRIASEDCLPLRARVLRPYHPLESCRFPRDGESAHFGAFAGEAPVAIVSAHPEDHPSFPERGQWRIRGMATAPESQGQGIGGALIQALLAWGRSERVPLFWCNAREGAIPFYLRHGFAVESPLFDIEGVGPHKVMKISL